MTYVEFLLLFVAAPIVVLLAVLRWRVERAAWLYAGLLALVALVYTAPWDNAIVLNQVWTYGKRQVLGLVIGVIPLEEYLFYGLQVAATILFCLWLQRRWNLLRHDDDRSWPHDPTARRRS